MTALRFVPQSGLIPVILPWPTIARAKRMMRSGWDLHETATALGVRVRDLDYSLWRNLGGEGWA